MPSQKTATTQSAMIRHHREVNGLRLGFPLGRLPHVHDDHNTEIVVDRDHAVEHADDHEPEIVGERRAEQVKLAHESAGQGNAGQGNEKNRQRCGGERRALSQPRVVVEVYLPVSLAAQRQHDAEGAEVHDRCRSRDRRVLPP